MKIPLPIDEIFELLKPGIVFSFENEKFKGKGKYTPHFYVLLNTPKENEEWMLLTVHATSSIKLFEDIEKHEPAGTLIYVKEDEYEPFEKERSVFDCNILTIIEKDIFIKKYKDDRITFMENDISSSIVLKLQKGVLSSRKVPKKYKKIIIKEIKND